MGGFFRQYSWIIDLISVLLCSFFLARITSVYIGKSLEVKKSIGVLTVADVPAVQSERRPLSDYSVIVDRNMFDPSERAPDAPVETESKEDGDESYVSGQAVPTSLGIKVIGVLVVGAGRDKRSTATVTGGTGKGGSTSNVYAVGDEESFAPNTKLVLVQPDRIEFLNGGRLEYAEVMADGGPSIFGAPADAVASAAPTDKGEKKDLTVVQEGGKFAVDQREVENALQNLDKLYTDIRAVPNFSGNKVSGMKILSVKNGSLFAKLGLRRGDVLQKINGLELDIKRGFEIFNQLKDQKSITLDLVRQGQPTTLEYEIR